MLKQACGMLQVIAKKLQQEEAKLAQVEERIECTSQETRDDRTSAAAPCLAHLGKVLLEQYAPRARHRGLKEEQQAALQLQLASDRLRTVSR